MEICGDVVVFVHWEKLCSLGDPLSCVLVPACCAHQGSLIDFLIWTVAFSSEMKGFSVYFLLIFVRLLRLTGKFSVIRWGRLFPLTVISSWSSLPLPSRWFSALLFLSLLEVHKCFMGFDMASGARLFVIWNKTPKNGFIWWWLSNIMEMASFSPISPRILTIFYSNCV